MRITADLVLRSKAWINPVRERELDLRGFKIPAIENLGVTQDGFDTIDLSDNEIRKIDNFPKLNRLHTLLVNNNHVIRIQESLQEYIPNLETLVLNNNKIVNLSEIDGLATLPKLKNLSLLENPVCKRIHYREYVIHKLPNLRVLDFRRIRLKERKEAERLFKTAVGKKIESEVQAEEKTFVPGEGLPQAANGPQKLTPQQVARIKVLISQATTAAEIDKLEKALKTGIFNFDLGGNGTASAPAPSQSKAPTPVAKVPAAKESPAAQKRTRASDPMDVSPPSPKRTATQDVKVAPTPPKPVSPVAAEKPKAPATAQVPPQPKPSSPLVSPQRAPAASKSKKSPASTPKQAKTSPRAKATPPPPPPAPVEDAMDVEENSAEDGTGQENLPSVEEVKKMKVPELKEALSALGLPVKGLKAELAARLLNHIENAS